MEYLFKTLVIGEMGTGKTAIIQRFVKDTFNANYKTTLGVDFSLKVVKWGKDDVVKLQLWDIAGQERFGRMTHIYYKEASACIIVFNITSRPTFEAVSKWKNDLDSKVHLSDGRTVPCILLANKCDLHVATRIPDQEIAAKAKELGFIAWFPVSAKDNININDAMHCLIQNILQEGSFTMPTAPAPGVIQLTQAPADSPPTQPESSCCGAFGPSPSPTSTK